MRKSLSMLLLVMIIFLSVACSPKTAKMVYNQSTTSVEGDPMLLGPINREGLQQPPYNDWFQANYADYTVDEAALEGLRSAMQDVQIKIFLGTWCSDSQYYVPQFYKILDYLDFPSKQLEVYSVDDHPDRRKTTPGGYEKGWNIDLVPTFIFLRDGQELGRITEYPMESLERDMAKILKGK